MKHRLFPLGELECGEMRAAEIDGLAIVVARMPSGEVRALRDVCSHHGARLSRGRFHPMMIAEDIGELELSDRMVIRCPWHGFEFDLETGRCPADPDNVRVRAYPVTIEDGVIFVER